ncbi:unnamed protein product [Parascedosporium putredinis]|uniref:Uncharacterized protein n=1 Tax=Parascedosporium putredinis TaxID=1442378 RepID=A0A9P1H0Z7_9PEZI|nr:unnamed protein product [Parascedosporium putredinis]CAI7993291.1 unnamed protein product [Parascedosporium putredinis]
MAGPSSAFAVLFRRQSAGDTFTVETECGPENDYDGRIGLRVSSIFVILVGSLLGALMPVILARSSRVETPRAAFFIAKYFGSGVIVATAFIHLLAPAVEALTSPCIDPDSPITRYSWAEGIALMTVFFMFFIELISKVDPGKTETAASDNLEAATPTDRHLSHAGEHSDLESMAMQMTAIFILEFGVIFHSIFIGLTLAVSGDEFVVLYIVLVFHQFFEGLGLGSRLAAATWPRGKGWAPSSSLIINGVFDSVSAGILLYTGLVELMAHEFLFNTDMRRSPLSTTLAAFACMFVGFCVLPSPLPPKMQALPPAPQPIGVFDTFLARQTETLIVDEKGMSLSGDSFDIKLASGAPLLRVQGNALSLRGRKEVFDMANNHLFTITSKLLTLTTFIGSKATITFQSNSGKQEVLVMKGNWRSSSAEIVDQATGFVVASIRRQRTAKHYLAGQQTYTVTVAPNVDMALAAAMCICMDEKNNEPA